METAERINFTLLQRRKLESLRAKNCGHALLLAIISFAMISMIIWPVLWPVHAHQSKFSLAILMFLTDVCLTAGIVLLYYLFYECGRNAVRLHQDLSHGYGLRFNGCVTAKRMGPHVKKEHPAHLFVTLQEEEYQIPLELYKKIKVNVPMQLVITPVSHTVVEVEIQDQITVV